MRWRGALLGLAAAVVSGCATSAAGIHLAWSPPLELSPEETATTNAACLQAASEVRAPNVNVQAPYNVVDGSAGLGGVIGYAIVAGVAQGSADRYARERALNECYANHDYVAIELTPEELTRWRRLRSEDERQSFAREIVSADPSRVSLFARKWHNIPEASPTTAETSEPQSLDPGALDVATSADGAALSAGQLATTPETPDSAKPLQSDEQAPAGDAAPPTEGRADNP